MDRQKVAQELVAVARELTAETSEKRVSGLRKRILDFIKRNRDTIESDEYSFARIKLFGPDEDSRHMNISLADLEAIAKVLK